MAQKKPDMNFPTSQNSYFKVPNIVKVVANHEFGLLNKTSFESRVTKLKVQQLKPSTEEFEIDTDISFCKFLRASDSGCLIGIWQKNMDPASKHSSVYHLKFEYNQRYSYCDETMSCPIVSELSCSGPFFKRMDVTDSCEENINGKECLLYVGNTAVSGGRVVLNISDSHDRENAAGLSEIMWRSPKCIWSCASNAFAGKFAAGAEESCFVFDLKNFAELKNFDSDVWAVHFNKSGCLLYCGTDKYDLLVIDLRENSKIILGRLKRYHCGLSGIKEIKLLSDELRMVVCGTDGILSKVDLRMNRPVFQYPGFVNKVGRRPVSVSEDLDLLCATGDDHCSRIWSLQSGELLKTIVHPVRLGRPNSHACLVADQRRWFVAAVEGNVLTPLLH